MKGNKWNKTYPYTIPGLFDVNILFSIPSLSLADFLLPTQLCGYSLVFGCIVICRRYNFFILNPLVSGCLVNGTGLTERPY